MASSLVVLQVRASSANDTVEYTSAGSLLTEAFNDGPAYWDNDDKAVKLIDSGVSLAGNLACERGEPTTSACSSPTGTAAADGNNVYLQDTRDWFAVHQGSVNILMADGGVRQFADLNGDGFLNPGFDVNGLADDEISTVGYSDNTVEMTRDRFFAGLILNDMYFKGIFEDD